MIIMGAKKRVHDILGPDEAKPAASSDETLEALADELIQAVKMGDAAGAASALKAVFAHCDAEPHEEGPHTGD